MLPVVQACEHHVVNQTAGQCLSKHFRFFITTCYERTQGLQRPAVSADILEYAPRPVTQRSPKVSQ